MPIDMYIKNPLDDTDYQKQAIDVIDESTIYINQIRNIFSCEEGMVMGAADMTINLEHYVFETQVSSDVLKNLIYEKLLKYAPYYKKFKTTVNVNYSKGTIRDIATIDITVDDDKKITVFVK